MKTYYKILQDGRSCNGGNLTWSLPQYKGGRWHPGEWHEVDSRPLHLCRHGLHLTSEPTYRRTSTTQCYEAEFDGEIIGPFGDELVVRKCRLVRRVQWSEFKIAVERDPEPQKDSPALTLLRHVWKNIDYRSHALANDAMQRALSLAIESGMEFGVDDFAAIKAEFRPQYWLNMESAYSRACAADRAHGENTSAYKAIEKHLGRKPFLVVPNAHAASKIRLCEGRRFDWHIDLKQRIRVTVTSFADDQSAVIACSYKVPNDGSYERKIDRRFRITHDDIAGYHKAIREAKAKSKSERDAELAEVNS